MGAYMERMGKWMIAGVGILMAGMLAACGGYQPADVFCPEAESRADGVYREKQSSAAVITKKSSEIPQDTDPQAPQEDLQQYLQQATVQVQGPEYLGSGVIWAEKEEYLVIATAAHVVEHNEPLTVRFYRGEPVEAQPAYVADRVDLAFLTVERQQMEDQEIPWQTARQDQMACNQLAAGQELLIMGSVEETADRIYSGSVTDSWIYLEDFDNYMLLGHAYAIPGVSGGGVFTVDGILVGILCGGNAEDEIAVLPYSVMAANYDGE